MKIKEKHYLKEVAELGCIVCGALAEIHHVRKHGEKRKHSQVIPLCYSCWQKSMGKDIRCGNRLIGKGQ